ncbi:MAG: hypothetical protein IBJ10_04320 [Phycisphaerales bacterium]|nr:hypothetical protein [Phycisphaerales bacterium]
MRTALILLAVASAAAVGCGKREEPKSADKAGASPASAVPAPRGPVSITRSSPVGAAESIRELAGRETAIDFLDAWVDPSQSGSSGLVGPCLMQFARQAALMDAAREKFGDAGADAVAELTASFSVDLGNGLAEMFEADRFEEVRRDGGRAYVMATLADGQPIGDPIVFKDNQGDWLLLLADGDNPWDPSRLGGYIAALGGALSVADKRAIAIDALIAELRAGRIDSVQALSAAIERINYPTRG